MVNTTQSINKTAIITDIKPNIYKDSQLTTALNISLPIDTEIKLIALLPNNSVSITLPNNIKGFICGDEELNIIQSAWAVEEIQAYSDVSNEAKEITINKGQEIKIYGPSTNSSPIGRMRIKLMGLEHDSKFLFFMQNEEGFLSEDSVCEFIGTSVDEGAKKNEIVDSLVEQGMSYSQAKLMVDKSVDELEKHLLSAEGKKEIRSANLKKMLFGLLWCIAGFVISAISLEMASSGGTYYVFYGLVIYGAWDILSGLYGWIKHSL